MNIFWHLLGKHKGSFLLLLSASSLVSSAEALLHPLMLKWLFDEGVLLQDFRRFVFLSLAYLALGLILTGLFYLVTLWRKSFTNRLVLELELRLLQHATQLDFRDYSRQGAGALVSRVHKDTLEGLVPMVGFILTLTQEILASVVFLGILLYLSWKATLALLLLVPPLLWVAQLIGKRVRKATSEEREQESVYMQVLTRSLEAFRLLRVFPILRGRTLEQNRRSLAAYLDTTYQNHRLLTLQQSWSDLFMNLANTLSLVAGGYFVLVRELTFGGFMAFVNAFWRAVGNVFSILQKIPQLHRYDEILRRIQDLLRVEPSPYAKPATEVHLAGVRLAYDNRTILDIPLLHIGAKERVLLAGPNGSGKTSLLHILAGYLVPDQGEVRLPQRIAALTAPPELPPLPLGEIVPETALLQALGLAAQKDQPADQLSSGQRQKAALGAVLSQEADLYILDEPLANIDEDSKEAIMDLIIERTRGKALVVVLHGEERFQPRFDRVVQIGLEGRVVAAG